ncbi:MAG TPA: DUF4157 domain-containing protein [Kofleriaceae bacterium]|nr:DUF4157 domain-containing protein [Kofleriaceae bacterium]
MVGEGQPLEPGIRQAMESFFQADFSGVRVHEGPAAQAMGALAFTLGEELHFAPGLYEPTTREGVELLGHELAHVVQQRDGRVANPYGQGVAIVQDPQLEAEADRMGQQVADQIWSGAGRGPGRGRDAMGRRVGSSTPASTGRTSEGRQLGREPSRRVQQATRGVLLHPGPARRPVRPVIQRAVHNNMTAMWQAVSNAFNANVINADSVLKQIYDDAALQLTDCNFNQVNKRSPDITYTPNANQPFRIDWDTATNLNLDADYFVAAFIHELSHAACSRQYRRNGYNQDLFIYANLNLPAAIGQVDQHTGMAQNQLTSYRNQIQTLDDNWGDLEQEEAIDYQSNTLTQTQHQHVYGRIQYARGTLFVHNDPVLADIMYYLRAKNRHNSRAYKFARRMLKEANDRRTNGTWSSAGTEVRRVDRAASSCNFFVW